jgi:hypothetical protein
LCAAGLTVNRGGELVLTPRGLRALADRLRNGTSAGLTKPTWEASRRVLVWGGRTVKRLQRAAEAQEAVLAAFEAQGWPERIDDPLTRDAALEPKQRLRDTVKNLNRHLPAGTIRFHTDGQGRGVRWQAVE